MRWLNENSRKFLAGGYLMDGVTPEERIREIAEVAEGILGIEGFADKFYGYMDKGYYALSSPVWSNFGTPKGLPISCFGSHIPDHMGGILTSQSEVGMMSKYGGGTSGYFGDLRPRGAAISNNGKSSGAVHFMKLFEGIIDVVSQGSTRRGMFSPYLPVDHPDIMEFLDIGTEGNPIQTLTHGVVVTDDWMKSMRDGDNEKRAIWAKVIQRRGEIGYPYIFFKDTVNNNTVDVYKDKDLTINHSNLCVTGSTKILTKKGYVEIESVVGQSIEIWNGSEWSMVDIVKTAENQDILRTTTSSGQTLDSTGYHKYYIMGVNSNGSTNYSKSGIKEVRASELKAGDKLIKFDLPVVEGLLELKHAYDNGFFTGDGTMDREKHKMYLYGEKISLADNLKSVPSWSNQEEFGRHYGYAEGLKNKFFVPSSEYTIKSRLDWLAGYLDADGTIARNGSNESLQAASVNKEFLLELQLMLQTLGVNSKVSLAREAGTNLLPKNNGTGELGEYNTKEINRILISSNGLYLLSKLGLKTNRLKFTERKPQRNAENFITIVSVEKLDKKQDTFCFTEPLRGLGMFNGILTGQCSEIALPNNEEWSFVCNLSSMNVLYYNEWKDTDAVETMIFFLDAVMTEFLEKLEGLRDSDDVENQLGFHYMQKAYKFAKENRALGLGVLGWHSLLQSMSIPFATAEAKELNIEINEFIQKHAVAASKELAIIFGEPEILKGYGRRNTTLTAIAP